MQTDSPTSKLVGGLAIARTCRPPTGAKPAGHPGHPRSGSAAEGPGRGGCLRPGRCPAHAIQASCPAPWPRPPPRGRVIHCPIRRSSTRAIGRRADAGNSDSMLRKKALPRATPLDVPGAPALSRDDAPISLDDVRRSGSTASNERRVAVGRAEDPRLAAKKARAFTMDLARPRPALLVSLAAVILEIVLQSR